MSISVLVTGGAGYIGSTLVPLLLEAGHKVTVVDRFVFGRESLADALARHGAMVTLIDADVCNLNPSVFNGIEAVVDLAGISNDPSCEIDPSLTLATNLNGALSTMRKAKDAGVARFVLASSCAVYGDGTDAILAETSELRPISLYANCKVEAEKGLFAMQSKGMCVTALRLATVFGLSRRMRFDLAINVMTMHAFLKGRITVDGGGEQWRPFVHVLDVAETIMAVLMEKSENVHGQAFNVGSDASNIRIVSLANRVRSMVPKSQIFLAPTSPDLRNYRVCFEKIHTLLQGKNFRSIEFGISEILVALRERRFDPEDRRWYTLKQYAFLAAIERTYKADFISEKVVL